MNMKNYFKPQNCLFKYFLSCLSVQPNQPVSIFEIPGVVLKLLVVTLF